MTLSEFLIMSRGEKHVGLCWVIRCICAEETLPQQATQAFHHYVSISWLQQIDELIEQTILPNVEWQGYRCLIQLLCKNILIMLRISYYCLQWAWFQDWFHHLESVSRRTKMQDNRNCIRQNKWFPFLLRISCFSSLRSSWHRLSWRCTWTTHYNAVHIIMFFRVAIITAVNSKMFCMNNA